MAKKMSVLLLCLTLTSVFTIESYADQEHKVFYGLGVGAFGNKGRDLGFAGGVGFSYCTLSVKGLPGESPLYVRPFKQEGGILVDENGDFVVKGDLKVWGKKKFVMTHPDNSLRSISYITLEGPEAGTYIRGTAKLVNGKSIVELPEHFSIVTKKNGLTVILTPVKEWLQLFVIKKSNKRIVVGEAQNKTGEFDYLVQGMRKGQEDFQVINDMH